MFARFAGAQAELVAQVLVGEASGRPPVKGARIAEHAGFQRGVPLVGDPRQQRVQLRNVWGGGRAMRERQCGVDVARACRCEAAPANSKRSANSS